MVSTYVSVWCGAAKNNRLFHCGRDGGRMHYKTILSHAFLSFSLGNNGIC